MVQIHPTCIPQHGDYQSKLTRMSESLRNDGRIWVPKKKEDAEKLRKGLITANDIPDEDRDFYLENRYPAFGNLVPRDVASRNAKERCDAGYGVNSTGNAVFLDFKYAIERLGKDVVEQRYGNLFQMYQKITDQDPYKVPMMIYPAIHYTMGGIWVDYELSTTIPGLFAAGEANFSDHGANRLGASALMQGLADGYFVLPYTVQEYLADQFNVKRINPAENDAFKKAENDVKEYIQKLMSINGKNSVDHYHKELGKIMWNNVGMARTKESLETAIKEIKALREEFWKNVRIPGKPDELNVELEKANRVADFLELGELIARDALHRNESCGGHFREESQEEGEAKRDDENFMYVGAWEYKGYNQEPELHKEPLNYQFIKVQKRNYKTGK